MIDELILASSSPRRQEFLKEMGYSFRVQKHLIEEHFSSQLKGAEIALFLAQKKAIPFQQNVQKNQLIITADTIVWHQHQCLGKPENDLQALQMLQQLSGSTHEVITAVGFLTYHGYESLHDISKVTFKIMSNKDITEYIASRQPFDKAGGYGIQDTFGKKVVQNIEGSFTNVVGLPVEPTQKKINEILERG